ncbi:hypothetical protein CMI37_00685 [Candidatus Pacearchaeota archaeon]|nr:hypothetical protein [Candidatus Pacearchaeota archaeon]|tara:strand:+ start:4401 stop:4658 length:258 start_codon:yes stop_codon:yes gene_type:complete
MIKKEEFGELSSVELGTGDIVEWTTWNSGDDCWDSNYGVLLEITNQLRSNRIVSISKVIPINEPHTELEFFTISLRLVNKSKNIS